MIIKKSQEITGFDNPDFHVVISINLQFLVIEALSTKSIIQFYKFNIFCVISKMIAIQRPHQTLL